MLEEESKLTANKELKNGVLLVRLSGYIDENSNFDQIIGKIDGQLHVNCKEIIRINSAGVRAWIAYFQNLQKLRINVNFIECSIPIVEQINFISNFTCGGDVQSIYVPLRCMGCKKETLALYEVDQIKTILYKIPPQKCPKCEGTAVFDDIQADYFNFLIRVKKT